MELTLSERSLVVFIDDTGHEALLKDQPVYGLGGCTIMATELERVIREPWREVRRFVAGSPDKQLHASAFGQGASDEAIAMVARYFGTQPFGRFGAVISTDTKLDDGLPNLVIVAATIKQRIIDIARWTPFDNLKVIFESSQRRE